MENLQLLPDESGWLTTKQAAEIWGGTQNRLSNLIKKFWDQLIPCVKYVVGRGSGGRQIRITQQGLVVLRNIAGVNNVSMPNIAIEGKKKIAEKAIAPVPALSDLDKLLAISQNLAAAFGGLNQKMAAIEEKAQTNNEAVAKLAEKIEAQEKENNKPLPVSGIHRQFLNDRVRMYAKIQQIDFPIVWRKVNQYVGRGGVAFYNFADFKLALKFVKNLFEEAGIDWE